LGREKSDGIERDREGFRERAKRKREERESQGIN
jgi:hypothetical protein